MPNLIILAPVTTNGHQANKNFAKQQDLPNSRIPDQRGSTHTYYSYCYYILQKHHRRGSCILYIFSEHRNVQLLLIKSPLLLSVLHLQNGGANHTYCILKSRNSSIQFVLLYICISSIYKYK